MGSGFRTFQSGEVLTSSNVQNYLMDQAIAVFAGTAARGSAIASPEAGMVSYRTDGTADSKREGFEFYDGANWTRLIPAAADSGLTLISSTTIGSAVSTVAVSNVFSSTYDNYLVTVSGGTSSAESGLGIQLGATTAGYYYAAIRLTYTGSANNLSGDNIASWPQIGRGNADGLSLVATIISPNLAKNTFYTAGVAGSTSNASPMGVSGGYVGNTTQYTGFTLTTTTGTITGGTIKVYGYKN